jgi:hypothetical protein
MPTTQVNIRMDEADRAWLGRMGAGTTTQWREDVEAMQQLLEGTAADMAGRISVAEARLLCDVLADRSFPVEMAGRLGSILVAEAGDMISLNRLDAKWGVSPYALLDKLRGLSRLEAYWLWHQARVFLARVAEAELDEGLLIKTLFCSSE